MNTKELEVLHNTSRVKRSKTGNKLFVKMMLNETLIKDFNIIEMCEHIGEAKLLSFIINKSIKNDKNVYYQNDTISEEFCKRYKLSKPSMFVYLRALTQKGVLIKQGKGLYKVSPKYIEFHEEN